MATATKYKASMTSEGLLIEGVIMAVVGDVKGRDFKLTSELFDGFVKNFDKRASKGNIGAYVLLDHDGPRVGKIVSLRHEDGNLIGDLLITESKVADRVKNSDLTDISITFWQKDRVLADVSLLDNSFGQLADDIPPLLVDVQQEFGLDADNRVECRYHVAHEPADKNDGNDKELTMEITPEQLNKMIADAVAEALKGRESDPEAEVQLAVSKAMEENEKRLVELERKHEIDTFVLALSTKDMIYTPKQIRTMFESKKTSEGREELFKRLKAMSKEDIKLEIETEYEKPSVETALREEYRKKAEDWKALNISEDQYVTMNLDVTADLK